MAIISGNAGYDAGCKFSSIHANRRAGTPGLLVGQASGTGLCACRWAFGSCQAGTPGLLVGQASGTGLCACRKKINGRTGLRACRWRNLPGRDAWPTGGTGQWDRPLCLSMEKSARQGRLAYWWDRPVGQASVPVDGEICQAGTPGLLVGQASGTGLCAVRWARFLRRPGITFSAAMFRRSSCRTGIRPFSRTIPRHSRYRAIRP